MFQVTRREAQSRCFLAIEFGYLVLVLIPIVGQQIELGCWLRTTKQQAGLR
jgi:hypothetical protein